MGCSHYFIFSLDIRTSIEFAGEKLFFALVVKSITLEYMNTNKEKISVAFPPEMIAWLKAESAREKQETSENISVSALVCRAVKAMQENIKKNASAAINPNSEISVGGFSTRSTGRFRRTG